MFVTLLLIVAGALLMYAGIGGHSPLGLATGKRRPSTTPAPVSR